MASIKVAAFRPFRFWATIGALVLVYVAVMVVESLAFFPAVKLLGPSSNMGSLSRLVIVGLGYLSAAAVILLLMLRISGRSMSELGIQRPRARDWAMAAAGFAAVVGASWIYLLALSPFGLASHVKPGFENFHVSSRLALGLYFCVLCFLGPAVEELIFRGFIYNALVQWARANWIAPVVINGIIFGMYHGDAVGFLLFALDGMIFALLYRATRNLIAPMIAHVGANTFMSLGLIVTSTITR